MTDTRKSAMSSCLEKEKDRVGT